MYFVSGTPEGPRRLSEFVADTGMRAWLEHEQPHVPGASALRFRLLTLSGLALGVGLAAHWVNWPALEGASCNSTT